MSSPPPTRICICICLELIICSLYSVTFLIPIIPQSLSRRESEFEGKLIMYLQNNEHHAPLLTGRCLFFLSEEQNRFGPC